MKTTGIFEPFNDRNANGSNYGLEGGIIDGNGKAVRVMQILSFIFMMAMLVVCVLFMKKNKILALTILALGIIYLLISLSLVLGRHTDKTDTSNSNQTGEETSANITDATSSNDNSTNTCEHLLSTEWSFENGQHFHKCTLNNCNFTDTKISCSGGKATCMQQAVCQFCNSAYGNLSDHVWTNEWDYSTSNGHAHKCSFGCDQHSEIQPHVPGPAATENSPQICIECNYVIAPATKHIHTLEKIASQSSTCTEKGNIEYFACVECSKFFMTLWQTKK